MHSWPPGKSLRGYENLDISANIQPVTWAEKKQIRRPIPVWAYAIAHWRLYSWSYTFSIGVVLLQISFGVWQCYKYATNELVVAAFGWGPAVAKLAAGALYPTFFFLVLSMSRWLATVSRYFSSREYVNWDRYRYFHIRMAITALALSILHTCGHVFGTFPNALKPDHREAVDRLIGSKMSHISWAQFLLSRPGWTGVSALMIFLLITACSMPAARRKSFETFQIVHLLIFPMLSLLAIHGSAALLQSPALGYVLAFPATIVLLEKLARGYQLFKCQIARISNISDSSVKVVIFPRQRKTLRFYRPGQYILIRVPKLSWFQWHPFTVVSASETELVVIAKDNGAWTKCLQDQPEFTRVNLDGPFGAPSQNFWHYDNNLLIGMGTGLTPSAAILNELIGTPPHPWLTERSIKSLWRPDYDNTAKRLSVMWIVRDATLLDAFSSLLKSLDALQRYGRLRLDFHLYISRSIECPEDSELHHISKKTGITIHWGERPVFKEIFETHHGEFAAELRQSVLSTGQPRMCRPKVGVFFCGGPGAKTELRQICFSQTLQGVVDGSEVGYFFHPEVF